MCLFMGKGVKGGHGSRGVRGGGSVIYGIPFGSWGKISTGTLSCLLLHLQYLIFLENFILLCFSLSNVFYIFICMLLLIILSQVIIIPKNKRKTKIT